MHRDRNSALAAAALLVAATSPAHALTYTLTSMVPAGFYTSGASNYPAINDLGQVASIGYSDGNQQQIGLSDGTQTFPLLAAPPFSVGPQIWLNNAGQVITNTFATGSSTTSSIVTAGIGSLSILNYPTGATVDDEGDFATTKLPNAPIVWVSFNGDALYLTSGSSTQILVTSNTTFGYFSHPYINAAGTICFTSQTGTQTSVYSITGGTIKRVSQSSRTSIGLGIDAAGDILWREYLGNPGSAAARLWLTSPAGSSTLIADTTTGAFSGFSDPYTTSVSINDAGQIAFVATLNNGKVGLFTGPDPVADKVLEQGDPLFGGIAGSVFSIGSDALNNNGSIAFLANNQNQSFVIRADIATPEPASLTLLAATTPLLLKRRRSLIRHHFRVRVS